MRIETCLACRVPGAVELGLREMVLLTESVAPAELVHHHHSVSCDGCGQWWFDDIVIGGLGIPVPSRRDTELCGCDEDLPQYVRHVIHVPSPERDCACTRAQVERFRLPLPAPSAARVDKAEQVRRGDAVSDIAARLGDRDAFVVAVPPTALADVISALAKLAATTCYLDCGLPGVIRVRSPHLAQAAAAARSQPPGTTSAVIIVPKTLPAARLRKLLGSRAEIPADGSQDVLMIQTADQFEMPVLLVDAIARHEPVLAAAMYAADVRRQS